MGTVYATITIKNDVDFWKAKLGHMEEQKIRQVTIEVMVDTGAPTLVINEKLRRQLGLEIVGERPATFANGVTEMVKRAGPVQIYWKNRDMISHPLVVSDGREILLGVIPLEEMDLMVDPVRQELTGAHGDEIVTMIMCA
jgi:clan AA aspartic protease